MLDTNTKKQWMWNSSAFYHARWTEIFSCSILLYSSSSFKIKYWNAILILTILCFFSKSFLLNMKDVFFIIFVISTFFLLSHNTYCLDLAAIISPFLIIPPAKFAGVYGDPYVRPFVLPSLSLIHYSSKTAEQNFMKLSGIDHYMMPYCTSYLSFYLHDFGVSHSKTSTLPLRHMGGPISNLLLLLDRWTKFLESFKNYSL